MWAVSDRFLAAIPVPHTVATTITYKTVGGSPQPLALTDGSVTTDRTQRIRRTANLTVQGGSIVYDALQNPGTVITINHGFRYSGIDVELVPMIIGEVTGISLRLGDGTISVTVADRWQGIAAADYLTPYSPTITTKRVTVITAAVNDVYPGITVRNTATDGGTIGTAQAWTSRADMINSLATDGGMEVFFAPDGALVIRNTPKISDPVTWLIKTGNGGTMKDLTRNRPLDKIYNAVILTPATNDPAQQWDSVTAVIADTNNPRHPTKLGRTVPYRYQAPSVLTQTDALKVANQILVKIQGSTETLSLGAVANPALEAGDIVRALTPLDGGNTIVNHFLDQAVIDLASGAMTCQTRANDEL